MFERIKKNWEDWKDGAEDREKAALIRKNEREILKIEKARIEKEKEEKGIISCGRCGYDHHYTAACEEAIMENERARMMKLSDEKGIISCSRCGYDHHYTAACEEAIADNEGIDIRELARDSRKSTGQRAQQSFISSIIFGVWK